MTRDTTTCLVIAVLSIFGLRSCVACPLGTEVPGHSPCSLPAGTEPETDNAWLLRSGGPDTCWKIQPLIQQFGSDTRGQTGVV